MVHTDVYLFVWVIVPKDKAEYITEGWSFEQI